MRRQLSPGQRAAAAANQWNGEKQSAGRPSGNSVSDGFSLNALAERWKTKWQNIEIAYGLKHHAQGREVFDALFSGSMDMRDARTCWQELDAAAAAKKAADDAKEKAAVEAQARVLQSSDEVARQCPMSTPARGPERGSTLPWPDLTTKVLISLDFGL